MTFMVAALMSLAATAQTAGGTEPEGQLLPNMEYCSKGMVPDYTTQQITRFDQTGAIAHVVRQGNKFYVQDPISHYRVGVWMEGELSADGTQVVFHLPQVFTTEQNVTYYLNRMVQSGQSLRFDATQNDLVFSYADGVLTQTDGGYLSITNAAGRTTSYVEYDISIRPVGQSVVLPPADAEHRTYMVSYESDGAPLTKTIDVAFSGSEVYIANPTGAKDSWIHGTIDGDRILCPNGQFLGADESLGFYVYMKAAEGSIEIINIPGFGDFPVSNIKLTDDEAIVFNYNAADGTFATDQMFLVNASAEKLADQHYDFGKAAFTPYQEVAATPADPEVVSCSGIIDEYGFGLFAINMPATDTQGNYINQENMYYNVYMDDKILQSPAGETDIPYNYTDGYYIRVSGMSHTYLYTTPITQRIGVQVFYRVGDVVNSSQLVWYDVNSADGVLPALAQQPAGRVEYFDVSGRRLDAASARGLVVRRTTLADGTRRVEKVCLKP